MNSQPQRPLTDQTNKHERAATKSWKVPSLVRALMVMCVVGVVGWGSWYSWQWWQREVERKLFLEKAHLAQSGSPNNGAFKGYEFVDVKCLLDSYVDHRWITYLQRAKFDWYVFILHFRFVVTPEMELTGLNAGVSFFRISPIPKHYEPTASKDEKPSRSYQHTKQDWHYVMDFAHRLSVNESTDEFAAVLIHESWSSPYKADPRFDFGELVE